MQINVLRNAVAVLTIAILVILGFILSVAVLAVLTVLGVALWGYLWWKTRKLRRAMREHAPDGQVIDGEAIVVEEHRVKMKSAPPDDAPR